MGKKLERQTTKEFQKMQEFVKKSKSEIAEGKTLVLYVDNSMSRAKVFDSFKKANSFIKTFKKENPSAYDGYWIDFLITDITGKIKSLDSTKIEKESE